MNDNAPLEVQMSKSDKVESGNAAHDKRLSAIWELASSRLGSKLSVSQRRMLAVAVTRGAELEPSGALAGPVNAKKKKAPASERRHSA
ncbi:hypothetical protein [Pseudomonas oryzihabitans]|uniref:hypothetical protein n=2 Tax=Pseudomonas TaxID=286 RepID=UPI001D7F67EC|nr:hypothetical protein [Pseudomonas oryzihabitans]HJE70778.1 hypothetical protein [Pseudomonas oryzihabitans]